MDGLPEVELDEEKTNAVVPPTHSTPSSREEITPPASNLPESDGESDTERQRTISVSAIKKYADRATQTVVKAISDFDPGQQKARGGIFIAKNVEIGTQRKLDIDKCGKGAAQTKKSIDGKTSEMLTCTPTNQTDRQAATPVVIEGYKVFKENEDKPGTELVVKEEPLDLEYDSTKEMEGQESTETNKNLPKAENSDTVRVHLQQMLQNRGKYTTDQSVVNDSLEKNVQSSAIRVTLQANTTNSPGRKKISPLGNLVQPRDPTGSCSKKGVALSNDALVEVFVTSDTDTDLEHVCAVSSKVLLNVKQDDQNEHLNAEITFYWCNFCSFMVDEKKHFLKHALKHRFHCKFCRYHCFSRAAIIKHCVEWHPETGSNLKYCSYLLDIFNRNGAQKRKASDSASEQTIPSKKSCNDMSEDIEMQSVMTNVISDDQTVSAATETSRTSSHRDKHSPAHLNPSISLNISSSLSWNCTYCDCVAYSQSSIVNHLKSKHKGLAVEYTVAASLSDRGLKKIKSTRLSHKCDKSGIVSKINIIKDKSSNSTQGQSKSLQKESDKSKIDSRSSVDIKKKPNVSFKCAHCCTHSLLLQSVKLHLFEHHRGLVMYALDMRVTKLDQQKYIFFCMKLSCSFQTKEKSKFLEHSKICTPWLTGSHPDVDNLLIKSLQRTQQFIEAGPMNELSGHKQTSGEYSCVYCFSHVSSTNTMVKKHVMSCHVNQRCVFKDLLAVENICSVYFCKYCLFETRKNKELETHLTQEHQIPTSETTISTTTASALESTRTTQKIHTSSDNQTKSTATDDTETEMETNIVGESPLDEQSSTDDSDIDEKNSKLDEEI